MISKEPSQGSIIITGVRIRVKSVAGRLYQNISFCVECEGYMLIYDRSIYYERMNSYIKYIITSPLFNLTLSLRRKILPYSSIVRITSI